MGDMSEQRRARQALARRRPAPGRVRARGRQRNDTTNELAAPRPWWRRVPWVHIGAVLGAVAAVGGLVLTGIATYYGAATARDQLEQSREEAASKSREQAERVWYWGAWYGEQCRMRHPVTGEWETPNGLSAPHAWPSCDDRLGQEIHVANRSADPVYGVSVSFNAGLWLYIGDMGPCTEVVYRPGDVWGYEGFSSNGGKKQKALGLIKSLKVLTFTDRAQRGWIRRGAQLTRTEPAKPLPRLFTEQKAVPAATGVCSQG